MIGPYETRMERSNAAWQAMVWGASQPDTYTECLERKEQGSTLQVAEGTDARPASPRGRHAHCPAASQLGSGVPAAGGNPAFTECDTCEDTGTVEVFGPLGATYYPPCPDCRGPASEE
jgi:hypothetical protein